MPATSTPASDARGPFASAEKHNRVVCLLLAVVVLALYNPVNHHPFVNYDDDRYVTENRHVRQGLTVDTIRWALTSTEQANWHPLTWMSHALDVSLFRLNPSGHHFTSVLLHAANVILLYLFLIWATGRFGPSLFVAALFALHPLQVESVAWVAERKNVLCTVFFLLTLWAYGWYVRKPGWARYLAVAALFAAGLASKPMVITLPFVLLLLDYWPLHRGTGSSGAPVLGWRNLILEKLPLFALSAGSAVITMRAQQSGGAVRTAAQFPFTWRVANATCAYAMYLWKMIWPAHLAPLYPHLGNSLAVWQIVVSVAVLLAVTAFVWQFRDRRYLLVGWLWFLGMLVPVIGLVQVGEAAMADRYTYIPLIGIFVMIAFGLADVAKSRNVAPVLIAACVCLAALAAATHRQIGYWQNNVDLWSHTLAVTRNNFVAEDNLAGALILEGKEEEAYAHFVAAAAINPRDPMSRSNLGAYYESHNRMREAIEECEAAITLTSDSGLLAQAYANLGAAQRALGDDVPAHDHFLHAVRLNPNQFNAWYGLGLLAEKRGNLTEAIADLARSLEIRPTADAFVAFGRVLVHTGHVPEAINAYQQALSLNPGLAEARQGLRELSESKP